MTTRAELYAAYLAELCLFLGCLRGLPLDEMLDAARRADVAGVGGSAQNRRVLEAMLPAWRLAREAGEGKVS